MKLDFDTKKVSKLVLKRERQRVRQRVRKIEFKLLRLKVKKDISKKREGNQRKGKNKLVLKKE